MEEFREGGEKDSGGVKRKNGKRKRVEINRMRRREIWS